MTIANEPTAPVDLPCDDGLDEAAPDAAHDISIQWGSWLRTRRFYVSPSLPPSVLGRMRSCPGHGDGSGPNARASAEMSAFNQAVESQPIDALDRLVFELHYRHRVKPIKTFAAALGISRKHWYALLNAFETRVRAAAVDIQARNEAECARLRSRS